MSFNTPMKDDPPTYRYYDETYMRHRKSFDTANAYYGVRAMNEDDTAAQAQAQNNLLSRVIVTDRATLTLITTMCTKHKERISDKLLADAAVSPEVYATLHREYQVTDALYQRTVSVLRELDRLLPKAHKQP